MQGAKKPRRTQCQTWGLETPCGSKRTRSSKKINSYAGTSHLPLPKQFLGMNVKDLTSACQKQILFFGKKIVGRHDDRPSSQPKSLPLSQPYQSEEFARHQAINFMVLDSQTSMSRPLSATFLHPCQALQVSSDQLFAMAISLPTYVSSSASHFRPAFCYGHRPTLVHII